jgi:hypothetical protein
MPPTKGWDLRCCRKAQPVYYASRTLTATEKGYAPIEKECLAIVFGCSTYHQYIAGREEIIVESDHKLLEINFEKTILDYPARLQRKNAIVSSEIWH